MIYTEKTCLAARIAYKAHENSVDACGMPYIMHPLHVAERMNTEAQTVVALLHDVVEDTDVTLDDLISAGFDRETIDAIDKLTHRPDVPYEQYLLGIKADPIALAVKLADIEHNSDETRRLGAVEPIPQEKIEWWREKYAKAIAILTDEE